MDQPDLHHQAEECRRIAHRYLGLPEGRFLLNVAAEFDRLAAEGSDRAGGEVVKGEPAKLTVLPPLP